MLSGMLLPRLRSSTRVLRKVSGSSPRPAPPSDAASPNPAPSLQLCGLEPAAARLLSSADAPARDNSLLHPLPGLDLPPPLPDNLGRSPTRVTTLPNGIRVATEDVPVMLQGTSAVPPPFSFSVFQLQLGLSEALPCAGSFRVHRFLC